MSDGTPADIWQDVVASYAALGDPEAGLALWNRKGSVEAGETRSHTLFWLSSLKEMGTPRLLGHGGHAVVRGVQGQGRRANVPRLQRAQLAHEGDFQHRQVRRRPAAVAGAYPLRQRLTTLPDCYGRS